MMRIVRDRGEFYENEGGADDNGMEPEDNEADEYVKQFMEVIDRDNQFARPQNRRLKPNLSKEWLEKISRTLEVWRLITNHSHSTS